MLGAGAEGSRRWITESYRNVASAFLLGGRQGPTADSLSSGRDADVHDKQAHSADCDKLFLVPKETDAFISTSSFKHTGYYMYHQFQCTRIPHFALTVCFVPYDSLTALTWSLDSSVGRAMGYRPDGRGSIPDMGNIFLFCTASRLAMGPT
jgi:hypothetical protein